VKPNGDVWICQDHPTNGKLNILGPDFDRKYRQADFSHRRACGGCTYLCHYVTQKSFEPRTWPDMAGLWWKTRTEAGYPCRVTAEKHGWVAGLLRFSAAKVMITAEAAARSLVGIWLLVALSLGSTLKGKEPLGTVEPEHVITQMELCNAQRAEDLSSYWSRRRYEASSGWLRRKAYVVVEARYTPGGGKDFRIVEGGGSASVQRRVFVPMLEAERANAHSPGREAVEISRRNYTFTFERYDPDALAYVYRAEPKTDNRYLLRGRIWVNAGDFAIQRIEGEPARRQSFWIHRTTFVHQYARFGGFWLPVSNRTQVELRLFGHATMGIDYFDYDWQPRRAEACGASTSAIGRLPHQPLPQRDRAAGEAVRH